MIGSLLVISFLNELLLSCLRTRIAIVSTKLHGFNYCYLTLIILFNIDHLFALSKVVTIMDCNLTIGKEKLITR